MIECPPAGRELPPRPGTAPRGIAHGATWVAVENLLRQLLGLGVFLALARLLGPASFGLMALATAITAGASLLVELGMTDAIVQRREGQLDAAHLDTAFWIACAAASLLAASMFLAAVPLAAFTGEPELGLVLRALSPLPLLTALATVPQALLIRKLRFRSLSLRTVLALLAGGVTGIGMALAGCGVWSLVGQQLVTSAVGVAVLWRAVDWRPGVRLSAGHGRELSRFGSRVLGAKAIDLVNRRGDDLVIGLVLGPVALGYYALAYQVLLALEQLLSRGFDGLSLSALSRLADDDAAIAGLLKRITRLAGMAAFPAFLGLAAVAPLAVTVGFGVEWLPAAPVIQVLALAGLLHVVFQGNQSALKARGRPDLSLALTGINAIVNLALLLAVVRWGVLAVAAAYVSRAYVLAPIGLAMVSRLIGLRPVEHLRPLVPMAAAAMVMTGFVAALLHALQGHLPPAAVLAVAICSGAVFYAVSLRVLAPAAAAELLSGLAGIRTRLARRASPA